MSKKNLNIFLVGIPSKNMNKARTNPRDEETTKQ
jgi:hypothetical protein